MFGGTIIAGYGWHLKNNLFLGVETSLDFSKRAKNVTKDVDFGFKLGGDNENDFEEDGEELNVTDTWTTTVKTNSVVPSLALRFGGVLPRFDCLIYVKGGVSYLQNDFYTERAYGSDKISTKNRALKMSKIVPIVGLGIEKQIYKRSSGALDLRLEWEHRFDSKKKRIFEKDNEIQGSKETPYVIKLKGRSSSDVVRLMLVYGFTN